MTKKKETAITDKDMQYEPLVMTRLCEDYKRSANLLCDCRYKAKFVFTDLFGKKKYLCGVHAKMYPTELVVSINEA